jgi:glycosyltransferase involved in cell wall biosynthesis
MKISIVIPFYNEAATLDTLVNKVLAVSLGSIEKEVILVNDGSVDSSETIAQRLAELYPQAVRLISFKSNGGKGRSVIEGLRAATGDILIVQDADLEYEPEDFPRILQAYDDPTVMVVFGSRILGAQRHLTNGRTRRHSYARYYWGGRLVTLVANLVFATHLTDEPTCYKSFRREVLNDLVLRSRGFEFCPEITAQILKRGYRIVEVPIRYYPRGFDQGKKIRYTDGLRAIWTLVQQRLEN